jgi:hypothetical protein
MLMPFGRHSGLNLEELPAKYLDWLAGLDLKPPLSDGVRRELERRRTGVEPEPRLVSFPAVHVKIPSGERALAQRLVRMGHKVLARKLDPAQGGDPETLRRLNELAAIVTEQLQEARS